jgi:uncharacterized protein
MARAGLNLTRMFFQLYRRFAANAQKVAFLIFALFLFKSFSARAAAGAADTLPHRSIDTQFSSNWMVEAISALPDQDRAKANLNFSEVTNLLCRESQNGNNAAKGLWGFVLVMQRPSPQAASAGLELLRDSAGKGYLPAMLNLGLIFEAGEYVKQDYAEAFHWFGVAAEKGSAEGQLQLGGCYHYGFGTNVDLAMAAKCYERAAEQTNYVAMKSLGYLLQNGVGVEKNLRQAEYWDLRAAKEGNNRRAMYNLGVIYTAKPDYTNSMNEAFHWLKQSADLGDALGCQEVAAFYSRGWGVVATNVDSYHYWLTKAATYGATDAQYRLGVAYRTGDGVVKNEEASLAWYGEAAAKNHPEALYDLAVLNLQDKKNPASLKLAHDYMQRAARMGHREAQFQCALSCWRGDVAPQDCEGGNKWLNQAAENGWPKAEFIFFQLYYYGRSPGPGCPPFTKDTAAGVQWLRRAAEHEDLQAEATLAVMSIQGKDVERDKVAAERLLRSAATHGYAPAQNDLGFALLNGDVTAKNSSEAAVWCQLAKSHATETNTLRRAGINLTNALAHLTAAEKTDVQSRVDNFRATPLELQPMMKDWEKNPDYQQEDGRFGH